MNSNRYYSKFFRFQVSFQKSHCESAERASDGFSTSNNTREISDALKRRCLHLYIPFPDPTSSRKLLRRVPEIPPELRKQLVDFIHELRSLTRKGPSYIGNDRLGKTLLLLHTESLDSQLVKDTLNVILKFQEDIENVDGEIASITAKINKT